MGESEKPIRIPLRLTTMDGQELPISGLIAIPSTALSLLEETVRTARAVSEQGKKVFAPGASHHATDELYRLLRPLHTSLEALDKTWPLDQKPKPPAEE